MSLKPAKPQVPMDIVALRNNVFTFAAADFAPWFLLSRGPEHREQCVAHEDQPNPPSAEATPVSIPSNANALAVSEPLDSLYWHLIPLGLAALPPLAYGGEPIWDHANQSVDPSLLQYSNYTLGAQASVLPQTVFRPGEALQFEKDSSDTSKLDTPDMLGAMALAGESDQSLWNATSGTQVEYDSLRYIEVPESDNTSSIWAEPEPIAADTANLTLPAIDPLPSQASQATGTTKKYRRLLPDRGERQPLPFSDITQRQSSTRSNPSSPPPRKLTRLRPEPRLTSTSTLPPSSPIPMSLEAYPTQLSLTGPPRRSHRCNEPPDLPNRTSRDEFLVQQRMLGIPYKEIRRIGSFTEAESTLRGRYRTLTKCREARVRKPEWSEKDLELLARAVRTLSKTPHPDPSKVPWKKVAEYIVQTYGVSPNPYWGRLS
ncbi:hypothetical protein B0T21DRAFT_414413 [Apiosordaria backusii]|uniref:Myb-like domain-containing protein n=1 Tax=Apiosordaria backusii TaxID=314023 RepID=A0AA40E197_9PEZI|nr:hypothetical protein B0T21DRAFT_414413 [Apiosordaria backusii]